MRIYTCSICGHEFQIFRMHDGKVCKKCNTKQWKYYKLTRQSKPLTDEEKEFVDLMHPYMPRPRQPWSEVKGPIK